MNNKLDSVIQEMDNWSREQLTDFLRCNGVLIIPEDDMIEIRAMAKIEMFLLIHASPKEAATWFKITE